MGRIFEAEGEGDTLDRALEVALGKAFSKAQKDMPISDLGYDFEIQKISGNVLGITGHLTFRVSVKIETDM
jgi:hypothetical protein